jgi:LytS/YehU family sensor histidine kinase
MLIENAIKHNEISDRKPMLIKVYTTDDHYLIVENHLQKKPVSEGSGTGIQNIRERYEFFTNKRVTIFENLDRFLVSIPLLTD